MLDTNGCHLTTVPRETWILHLLLISGAPLHVRPQNLSCQFSDHLVVQFWILVTTRSVSNAAAIRRRLVMSASWSNHWLRCCFGCILYTASTEVMTKLLCLVFWDTVYMYFFTSAAAVTLLWPTCKQHSWKGTDALDANWDRKQNVSNKICVSDYSSCLRSLFDFLICCSIIVQ